MKIKGKTWKPASLNFSKYLNNTLQQQHHASQFIALVGRYLVPQKDDDSNTNMQYLPEKEMFIGNEFDNRFRIALQLQNLKLCIFDKDNYCKNEIPLVGKTKQQVFTELKQTLASLNVDVSKFINELHYELPLYDINSDSLFIVNDMKDILENIFYRHNAEIILNEIAAQFEKAEPVRIWPHHFDTGSFVPMAYNNKGDVSKSIGLGWSIPDDIINEPYFYLSFWSETPVGNVKDLAEPEAGEWIKTGWNGGVLKLSEILMEPSAEGQIRVVRSFFNSGIKLLSEHFVLSH